MSQFLAFARRVVRDRAVLVFALAAAVFSALNLGAGLAALVPVADMVLEEDARSLRALVEGFNAEGRTFLGMTLAVPVGLVAALPTDRFQSVVWMISGLAILTVVGASANFLHRYLSITVATRSIANARTELFRTAIGMPLARVHERGTSEFVARIIRDTAELQKGLQAVMSKAVAESTQAVVLFVVAILLGRSVTLAALLAVPLLAIFLRKVGKRIRRGTEGALRGQEDLLRLATESVQGLRAVKANRGERDVMRRFDASNREVIREELRAQVTRAFASPVTEALAFIIVGGLLIFAARAVIEGTLDPHRVIISLGALGLAGSKLKILSALVNELQGADATARRVLDVLDEPIEDPGEDRPALPRHAESIRFEAVRFTYPGADAPALDGVDLALRHGERVAVVGPNGSGKTTLLSLLPRLLEPDSGCIRIDGRDVREVSLASLREQVAVVTQESVLFRGTIADNIAFGHPDHSRADMEAAARQARAHDFIQRIPGGYDADVFEQGTSLSGGQRQRLCIARAILRDPSILILDEATSQVDAESEAEIAKAIEAFGDGRTVLLIAHRLATVLDADRIVVMDAGRIVDEGPHERLLETCPLYARLVKTQLVVADA